MCPRPAAWQAARAHAPDSPRPCYPIEVAGFAYECVPRLIPSRTDAHAMFDWIADPNAWIALATLTALEIVLGIDNIIFISILVAPRAAERRDLARRLGLGLAMGTRIAAAALARVDHAAARAAVHARSRRSPGAT